MNSAQTSPSPIITVNDVYSSEHCQQLILSSEANGYNEAAIDTGAGQRIIKDIRNNDRIFFDDYALAQQLYKKVHAYLPECINGWKPYSLNERFRFYRYKQGHYFK